MVLTELEVPTAALLPAPSIPTQIEAFLAFTKMVSLLSQGGFLRRRGFEIVETVAVGGVGCQVFVVDVVSVQSELLVLAKGGRFLVEGKIVLLHRV